MHPHEVEMHRNTGSFLIACNVLFWTCAYETVSYGGTSAMQHEQISAFVSVHVCVCVCVCLYVSVCTSEIRTWCYCRKKGPVGIVDTVIKQPETLTRRQGRGNNITWGWIKENLNNIICVAFVNSLPCSHSLSYIHSPMLMTLAFMLYLSLTCQISFFLWNLHETRTVSSADGRCWIPFKWQIRGFYFEYFLL